MFQLASFFVTNANANAKPNANANANSNDRIRTKKTEFISMTFSLTLSDINSHTI